MIIIPIIFYPIPYFTFNPQIQMFKGIKCIVSRLSIFKLLNQISFQKKNHKERKKKDNKENTNHPRLKILYRKSISL